MWRAYVKQQTEGSTGRPDLALLAARYRAFRTSEGEQVNRVRWVGALATQLGKKRQVGRGQTSLGLQSRCQRRRSTHLQLMRFWTAHHRLTSTDLCFQIAQQASIGALSWPMKLAMHCGRQASMEKAKELAGIFETIDGYEPVAVAKVRDLVNKHEALQSVSLVCRPVAAYLDSFGVANKRIVEDAKHLCSWSVKHPQTNLGPCLEESWRELHSTVQGGASVEQRSSRPRACLTFGLCICQGSGQRAHRLRAGIHREMKAAFASVQDKKLLQDGFVVMQLHSDVPTCPSSSSSSSGGYIELFLHVSMHYYKPYRSTYHVVKRACAPPGELCARNPAVVFVEVCREASMNPQSNNPQDFS